MNGTEMASGFSICDLYPSIMFLPSITGMRKRLQKLVSRTDKILDSIIHDHISKERGNKLKERIIKKTWLMFS